MEYYVGMRVRCFNDCAHMLFEKLPDNAIRSAIKELDHP